MSKRRSQQLYLSSMNGWLTEHMSGLLGVRLSLCAQTDLGARQAVIFGFQRGHRSETGSLNSNRIGLRERRQQIIELAEIFLELASSCLVLGEDGGKMF